ncbi:MAG: ATP-binding protein [Ignavibacteria bacterium]|nr:ATP-binding protein [Ignavibacteria bacterium]
MFNIVKANEPLIIKNVNILIYGEPGVGKTSLANTAINPLTLDFDNGIHRSDNRKDVFVVENWKVVNNNMNDFMKLLSGYNTIIIDTVDTLLDYMGAWIIEQTPRYSQPKYKLQFYGSLKDEFAKLIGRLRTLGKDVVCLAHMKEKDEGDLRIKRPAITGGSYDRVMQLSDFVGYLFIKDNKRTLDFNPTDFWFGKNSAKFDQLQVPDFKSNPDFLSNLIIEMKNSINKQTQAQAESVITITKYNQRIQDSKKPEDFNFLMSEMSNLKNGVKVQLWENMQKKANQLGFEFLKKEKKFVAKQEEVTTTKELEQDNIDEYLDNTDKVVADDSDFIF